MNIYTQIGTQQIFRMKGWMKGYELQALCNNPPQLNFRAKIKLVFMVVYGRGGGLHLHRGLSV